MTPKRFVGERLDLPGEIEVPGFAKLRVELYAARGEPMPPRPRMASGEWEVNDAHDDYRALCADPRSRLRYFVALFAREIVLRNAPSAENARVVDILTHVERNLSVPPRTPRG